MTREIALHSEEARVGLVLSGGGASAAYQAGVVKALAELDVQVHAVAGASAGALNGVVVSEANGDLKKAAIELEKLWTGLIANSPIEWQPGKFVLGIGLPVTLAAARKLPRYGVDPVFAKAADVAAVLVAAFERAGVLSLELADAASLEKMLDRGMKRLLKGEGLPLYVSIFESEDMLTDLVAVGGMLLELWDTPPSEFRHIQSLPPEERKATILASAAMPIVLQARRLGPDDRRFVDGVLGDYCTRQGNTPAEPLVDQAGCTHLIVTHSSDGSPWRRDRFPNTTVLEVRPGQTMRRTEGFAGETRDMFNFSEDILYWIEQGYEDAMRCVGEVKHSLDLVGDAREASERRRQAVDHLDNDSFWVN